MGLLTDFASVPRVLKLRWPSPGGAWDKPAVVHDYLYRRGVLETRTGLDALVTRAEADRIFLEAMAAAGVGWLSRRLLYWGVRVGGGPVWAAARRRQARRAAHD